MVIDKNAAEVMGKLSDTVIPYVGMGATEIIGTFKIPYTVIDVNKSLKKIVLRSNKTVRIGDKQKWTWENQEYEITEDLNGKIIEARLNKYEIWKVTGKNSAIRLGKKQYYVDYSI